jgi:hypothetical protein
LLMCALIVLMTQRRERERAKAEAGGNASMVPVSSGAGEVSLGKHAALLEMTRQMPEKKTPNSTWPRSSSRV